MPTNTYTPIGTITLSASASEVIFSGIPASLNGQSFRDLVLVVDPKGLAGNWVQVEFNNDTTTLIPGVRALGDGSTTIAQTQNNAFIDAGFFNSGAIGNTILQIMDYTATDKHKTVLNRWNNNAGASANYVAMAAFRYPVTTAITSIKVKSNSGNLASGTTMSLYAIAG